MCKKCEKSKKGIESKKPSVWTNLQARCLSTPRTLRTDHKIKINWYMVWRIHLGGSRVKWRNTATRNQPLVLPPRYKSPAQRRCSSGMEWLYTEQRPTSESILSLNKNDMRTDFCCVSNRFLVTSGIIFDGSVQRTMDWANSMTIMTLASIAPAVGAVGSNTVWEGCNFTVFNCRS